MHKNESYKAEYLSSEKDNTSYPRYSGEQSKANEINPFLHEQKISASEVNDEGVINSSDIKIMIDNNPKKVFFRDDSIELKKNDNMIIKEENKEINDTDINGNIENLINEENIIIKTGNSNSLLLNLNGLNLYSYINLNSKTLRKYSIQNIDKGKNFFKIRYIKEKFSELLAVSKSIEINNTNIILNDNKNAIKFNSLFLQKLEKGIFSFNLKKFDESFNYLLGTGIIKNEEEFGELLLTVQGFDKYIIGNFLAKEKFPNKDFIILKSFMQSIEFAKMNFLTSLRFLLSRVNLPKDSILILAIINEFSEAMYKENQNLYKDINSIYLLASTVLALNTIFHKGIDNVKIMKKEEFVAMNKDVNKELAECIYEEIKVKKLDIVHEYNELIYRRLSVKVKQNDKEIITDTSMSNELKGEDLITPIKEGTIFIKYGKYGKPHLRMVKLSQDEKKIVWYAINGCKLFKTTRSIEVLDIKDVYIGSSASKIFEKYNIPPDFDSYCFSIVTSKRSLDLRKDDESICKKWYQAIRFIIRRSKSVNELKNNNLRDVSNRNEILCEIWKTQILPNWHIYRSFVIRGSNIYDFPQNNLNGQKKNKVKFDKLINQKDEKFKILDEKDKSEFLYIWTLGLPSLIRKNLWYLIIGNGAEVSENLYNFHLQNVEKIDFMELTPIENIDERFITRTSGYIKQKELYNENPILNEIINDVIKVTNKYSSIIYENKLDLNLVKQDLYNIVRVFTLFRPDTTYSQQITYISLILLLNTENYYSAFVALVNFIVPSLVMKFLIRDETYIKIRLEFFDKLLKSIFPQVATHFQKLDVSTSLYFFNWMENVFVKTFNYRTLLRLWDIYLLKGELFLYEIGLGIIKLLEKDLISTSVKDILKSLKKMPLKINEDEFLEVVQDIDIRDEYKKMIFENNLALEKGILFQSFLND